MRNILKGFLEPKAEVYVLPDAKDIRFEGENFDLEEEAEETPLEAETSEEGAPQESEAETPKAKGKRKLFGRREKSEE